jgi:hypothetical protein
MILQSDSIYRKQADDCRRALCVRLVWPWDNVACGVSRANANFDGTADQGANGKKPFRRGFTNKRGFVNVMSMINEGKL